jgi:hypothetical protein
MAELCGLHRPTIPKEMLARLHLRQIEPPDISSHLDILFKKYPALFGDPNIGPGDDGNCQSWCGDWDWYQDFLKSLGIRTN